MKQIRKGGLLWWVIINTDGNFFQSSLSGGLCFVTRDSLGEAVTSAAGRGDHVGGAIQTGAVACLKSIQAAHHLSVSDAELEMAVNGEGID
jgi:hypothetical protein